MVAYNFVKEFAEAVEKGRKSFTIRDQRKGRSRHSIPGEKIQLYTGMRTKACRKLVDPDPICEKVVQIKIYRNTKTDRCDIVLDEQLLKADQVDYIIVADGFNSHKSFMEYHLEDAKTAVKVFIQWGFWNAE